MKKVNKYLTVAILAFLMGHFAGLDPTQGWFVFWIVFGAVCIGWIITFIFLLIDEK